MEVRKKSILQIKPYKPGEGKAEESGAIAKLSANENPLGCSPDAISAINRTSGFLNRYPDGGSVVLRNALSTQYDIPKDNIVCGAGSDEVINLLITAFTAPGDEVLYSEHGFLMYKIYALAHGAVPIVAAEKNYVADIESLLGAVTNKTRIVFLANPNNPTGTYLTYSKLKEFRERLADNILLVIDAAYAEYVERDDYEDGLALVREFDNVVMTRTFSKLYGLASLRLGYAISTVEICDILNRIRGPFNVNLLSQAAGIAALEDDEFVQKSKDYNNQSIKFFTENLTNLGFETLPTVANFILFKAGDKANELVEFMQEQNINIRNVAAYNLPEYVRVTFGTTDENHRFFTALEEFTS